MTKRLAITLVLVAALLLPAVAVGPARAQTGTPVFINELHYDNDGTDAGEAVEVAGPAGTDLAGWTIVLYNGNGGASYDTTPLSGTIPDQEDGYGTLSFSYPVNGIQNGSPDGLALVNGSTVVQFLSYEGTFTAVGGPADGMTSTDIGVTEGSSTPEGYSLQLTGTGTVYEDFAWTAAENTFGAVNAGQTFGDGGTPPPPPPPPFVSIHDIQYTEDAGGASPYDGQEVTTEGIVTAFFNAGGNRYTFIQDGSGPWSGLLLYQPSTYVNVGDRLSVAGTVTEHHSTVSDYYGVTEIAKGTTTVLSSDNPLPDPEVLSTGEAGQEQWESVLVRVEGVTVTNEDLDHGEWEVDDGSGAVCVDDLGYYSYSPADGDVLEFVQGPLYYSFGAFKIEPRDNDDLKVAPLPLSIMQIQGNGQHSPYDGKFVSTSGIVTAVTRYDFWMQDPAGDGDPATSDGIYVYGGHKVADVAVGDEVRVTATAQEYGYPPALPVTELSSVSAVEILSSDNPLPAPVTLVDLPGESIADGIAFWEPLESMRVSVQNAMVVGPTSSYGEFAMLTEADAVPGSGYFPQTKQVLISSLGGEDVDYNPERILVDDSTLDEPIMVLPGDVVTSLTGVVDYTYGNYKLQPTSYEVDAHKLPSLPASKRSGAMGNLRVTSFNVENLFDLVLNPAKDDASSTPTAEALEAKLDKLALAIRVELELPEILVVEETENQEILQVLGDRVNEACGTAYTATSFETSDARGIEVGFLWDANRVSLVDAYQATGADVEAAFGPASESPGREPLVGVFEYEGRQLTIIGNHLKSKGGDAVLFGESWPPERPTEVQRKLQATVVRRLVNDILDVDPDALLLVTGDMNDFSFAEPGEGADHPLAILEGGEGEVSLTDLLGLEKEAERFTYLYDGNSEVLDHMLVSPALLKLTVATDVLHFNAGFPPALGEDSSVPFQSSDHDPVEGRFEF